MTKDELTREAFARLKPKRVAHVRGVVEEARKLARRYGVDEDKAEIAALLHDVTKKDSYEQQLQMIEEYGIPVDEEERSTPPVLHARTGARVAREQFGVDREIEDAIDTHTTGAPGMSTLGKIIYLADCIEPNRDYPSVDQLRKLSYENLDKAMASALRRSLDYIAEKGQTPFRRTVEACRYYENLVREQAGQEKNTTINGDLVPDTGRKPMTPEEIVKTAVEALEEKKAEDIRVLRTTDQTVLADYFVICNGTSSAQIKALVGEVDKKLSEKGESPRREGLRSDKWVLMDFGPVIVHVFTDEARKFYNLERLWSDSEEVDLSSL